MEIVSKQNSLSRFDRIKAIAPVFPAREGERDRKRKAAKPQPNEAAVFNQTTEKALDGHTLIAAQVIATRYGAALDYGAMASRRTEATMAYGAAQNRSIHRMAAGSFYEEAA